MTNKDFQTAVRFPKDVVRRLDLIAERMTRERQGIKVTRAAVIRMMVMENLESEEKKVVRSVEDLITSKQVKPTSTKRKTKS